RFIPELGNLRVAAASAPVQASRDITVEDLLTHTSGLMSGGPSSDVQIDIGSQEDLGDVLPRLGAAPLDFEPGTRWAYSAQFGFDVLARIVEIASGVAFDTFAKERIFDRLGMDDTFFYPAFGHPRLTTLYQSADSELSEISDMTFMNGAYFSGGGGLFSTAEDYLQFALVLLNDGQLGHARLLGRRTAELMHSAFVPDTLPGRSPGEGYGLGVRVVTDPIARNTFLSEGSFGWSGAFNTHFFIDPQERIVGIFMTQSAFLTTRQQLRDDFETAVMQALID
ncbi:MAG TPA: serine hydrolase domain-containing protein, partial [Gammaproteobacteria bacterium]|nr:serine hydrolase domain-containing protein [Gammaproteobacteria bacterium]